MTPYEAWFGKKPKVEHLRVFGCDAYAHIPKDERGKLDSKARKCILLGYERDRKGYRLYDPVQQKILHSRDVRFNEAEKTEAVTGDSAGVEADHHLVVDFSDPDVGTPNRTVAPILRRSARLEEKEVPDYFGRRATHLSRIHCEPISIEEATSGPYSLEWMQAMEAEMKYLKANDVWELVDLLERKLLEANGYSRSRQGQMVRLSATRPDWLLKVSHRSTELTMMKPSAL